MRRTGIPEGGGGRVSTSSTRWRGSFHLAVRVSGAFRDLAGALPSSLIVAGSLALVSCEAAPGQITERAYCLDGLLDSAKVSCETCDEGLESPMPSPLPAGCGARRSFDARRARSASLA